MDVQFFIAASPTGNRGLRVTDEVMRTMPPEAFWGMAGLCVLPEDGPAPAAPRASYGAAELAHANRNGYRCEGYNTVGWDKPVPLETVLNAARRSMVGVSEKDRAYYTCWKHRQAFIDWLGGLT